MSRQPSSTDWLSLQYTKSVERVAVCPRHQKARDSISPQKAEYSAASSARFATACSVKWSRICSSYSSSSLSSCALRSSRSRSRSRSGTESPQSTPSSPRDERRRHLLPARVSQVKRDGVSYGLAFSSPKRIEAVQRAERMVQEQVESSTPLSRTNTTGEFAIGVERLTMCVASVSSQLAARYDWLFQRQHLGAQVVV